ncbi:aminotransferase class V-fold PLP-dependent enzyme [Stenotrophomonas mori]|uniref:Aminotransferase class V-fold PLP-dependent enzyme n=1 Tax=Stenotrophomonas mori TaxID=2871096 RepID=A0ABT0SGK7_9GAMM|nr:aminotransferase class V-fold PLP-dependent enzyme [Stenotrophomonas mori]MCL7714246.1 aminotransferase class V-fold PLP-dependent enzyme [Stenotrophomonas mori]
MDIQRRRLLRGAAALPLAAAAGASASAGADLEAAPVLPPVPPGRTPEQLAHDEDYWAAVAAQYDLTDEVAMLDNGYWGAMARPVLRAYAQATAEVNRGNAWFGRVAFPRRLHAVRQRLAGFLGVGEDEVVFTRGATEALQALIGGYNRLRPGDQVLYADIDYDSTITAMRWLGARRGAEPVAIALPEPCSREQALETYARALQRTPRLKLMLLTQVNHRNGMLLPVAEIAALARARGVDVIVDAAHAIGQVDTRIDRLEADFAGINLHKWIGAPVGVGAMYVRRGRVDAIDPYMGDPDRGIDSRIHTGTANFAGFLAVPAALDFHEAIGVRAKRARLLRLRNQWRDGVRDLPGVQLLGTDAEASSSAIASFRLRGQVTLEQNIQVARRLLEQAGVFTVHRDGLVQGACVRVTPGVFTSPAQIERLVAGLRRLQA